MTLRLEPADSPVTPAVRRTRPCGLTPARTPVTAMTTLQAMCGVEHRDCATETKLLRGGLRIDSQEIPND